MPPIGRKQVASDVVLVQTALQACKNKSYKPYYSGRVDGKCGPKTIAAIEGFQGDNQLKVTGKFESYGPGMNKLRMKTPISTKNALDKSGGGGHGAGGSLDIQRVTNHNKKLAEEIKAKWPLPKQEADDLAACVKKCSLQIVPLKSFGSYPVTIDNLGRFVVRFDLAEWATPDKSASSIPARTAMVKRAADIVSKSGHWLKGMPNTLQFKSAQAYKALNKAGKLNSEHKQVLQMPSMPNDPVVETCCSGLAQALLDGRKSDAIQLLDSFFSVAEPHKRTLYASLNNGVMTDAVFEKTKPYFSALWNSFYKAQKPTDKHISEVLGGYVEINAKLSGSAQWKNFCAVRISHALNKAGDKIPFIKGKTVSSKSKDWHLFRVSDLNTYLTSVWGSPDIHIKGKVGKLTFDKLHGKNGLLIYIIPSWNDATGHATIWDGRKKKIVDDDGVIMDKYLKLSSELKLWVLP